MPPGCPGERLMERAEASDKHVRREKPRGKKVSVKNESPEYQ